jgi:hypothetical protein
MNHNIIQCTYRLARVADCVECVVGVVKITHNKTDEITTHVNGCLKCRLAPRAVDNLNALHTTVIIRQSDV